VEPDRFAAVAAEEQQAAIAVHEECLVLQEHLAPVPAEPTSHRRAILIAIVLLLLLAAAAYLVWAFVL